MSAKRVAKMLRALDDQLADERTDLYMRCEKHLDRVVKSLLYHHRDDHTAITVLAQHMQITVLGDIARRLQEQLWVAERRSKQELQLRNCMALALRQQRRAEREGRQDLVEAWEHILRFCKDAGVEPSPLRAPARKPKAR